MVGAGGGVPRVGSAAAGPATPLGRLLAMGTPSGTNSLGSLAAHLVLLGSLTCCASRRRKAAILRLRSAGSGAEAQEP